jgi:hypothetical protein
VFDWSVQVSQFSHKSKSRSPIIRLKAIDFPQGDVSCASGACSSCLAHSPACINAFDKLAPFRLGIGSGDVALVKVLVTLTPKLMNARVWLAADREAPKMAEIVRRVDADPRLAELWETRFPFHEGWEG